MVKHGSVECVPIRDNRERVGDSIENKSGVTNTTGVRNHWVKTPVVGAARRCDEKFGVVVFNRSNPPTSIGIHSGNE